jgi:hypothetical protein
MVVVVYFFIPLGIFPNGIPRKESVSLPCVFTAFLTALTGFVGFFIWYILWFNIARRLGAYLAKLSGSSSDSASLTSSKITYAASYGNTFYVG